MNEEQVKALREQILDMQDKLDEFVEEMEQRLAGLKKMLNEAEREKPKVKDYERSQYSKSYFFKHSAFSSKLYYEWLHSACYQ